MVGGMDSPMQFRETMAKFIETGQLPKKPKRSSSAGGKPGKRPAPQAPRANMKAIRDLRSRLGQAAPD